MTNPKQQIIAENIADNIASEELVIEKLRAQSRKDREKQRRIKKDDAQYVKVNNKAVKFSGHKASLYGFTKDSKLPHHFEELFNEVRRFVYSQKDYIDKNGIVHTFSKIGHSKLHKVLVVLLSHCDFTSGKVGRPSAHYMDTYSHDYFMRQYSQRFGEPIPSTTWYRYIAIAKALGIFSGEAVKLYNKESKKVHSKASYKNISIKFLIKIGSMKDHISDSIKRAYNKAIKKGLSFVWKVEKKPIADHKTSQNFDLFNPSAHPQ